MFYVLEPQRNISTDEFTQFVPCSIADATVFAIFSRESYEDDPEYLGDVTVEKVLMLIKSAD